MNRSYQFAHVFFVLSLYLVLSNVKRFPNHHIKAKTLLPTTSKSNLQAIQTQTSKLITSTSKSKIDIFKLKDPFDNDVELIPLPRIELFVRKYSQGFWTRFKGIHSNNTVINDQFNSLRTTSGIEEETIRYNIDQYITNTLFGDGLGGERNFITNLKTKLPRLKKLKTKEFEFGYKYVKDTTIIDKSDKSNSDSSIDDEYIYETLTHTEKLYSLLSLERPRIAAKTEKGPKYSPESYPCSINSTYAQLYNSYLSYTTGSSTENGHNSDRFDTYIKAYSTPISNIQYMIHQFYTQFISHKCQSLLVVCDGSAYFYNQTCTKSSAGIYMLPLDRDGVPVYSIHLPIRIHSAQSLISTPFDAELLGGMAAITLIRAFLEYFTIRKRDDSPGIQHSADTGSPAATVTGSSTLQQRQVLLSDMAVLDSWPKPDNFVPEVLLLSDSKTICRVFRQSALSSSGDNTLLTNSNTVATVGALSSSSVGDDTLLARGLPSRPVISNLLSSHFRAVSATPQPHPHSSPTTTAPAVHIDDSLIRIEWVPGHPERRNSNIKEWSLRDNGIWVADEVAKGVYGASLETNQADIFDYLVKGVEDQGGSDEAYDGGDDESTEGDVVDDEEATAAPADSSSSSALDGLQTGWREVIDGSLIDGPKSLLSPITGSNNSKKSTTATTSTTTTTATSSKGRINRANKRSVYTSDEYDALGQVEYGEASADRARVYDVSALELIAYSLSI